MKVFVLSLVLLGSVFVMWPAEVVAQGLVPCSGTDCDFCDVAEMTNGIIQWLFGFLTVCAVLVFVYAGLKMVTSGGDPGALTYAKERLTYVIIGFLLMLASWLIVDTILKGLTGTGLEIWGSFEVEQCGGQVEPAEFHEIEGIAPPDSVSDLIWPGDPQSPYVGSNVISSTACAATPAGNRNCSAASATCSSSGGTPSIDTSNPDNYIVNCVSAPVSTTVVNGSGSTGCSGGTCVPLTIPCANASSCSVAADMVSRLSGMHNAAGVSGARVTEAMPPSRQHESQCHYNGTCVDYSKSGGMSASEVLRVINAAQTNNLRPVYEVQTQSQKDTLVYGGVPSGYVVVLGSWISAPHFSIYAY